jgi:hypothetical protein
VAIFAVVMFGFAAIIVDLGAARAASSDAQNAADASVLAAAEELPEDRSPMPAELDDAVEAAKDYARDNYRTTDDEWDDCLDSDARPLQPGGTECISFTVTTDEVVVRVRIPERRSESFFGGIVGFEGLWIRAAAEVTMTADADPDCVLCVLGPGTGVSPVRHNLAGQELRVDDGSIWFNGNVQLGLNGEIETTGDGRTHVQGTVDKPLQITPAHVTDNAITDPLQGRLASFLVGAPSAPPLLDNPCQDGPGVYGTLAIPPSTQLCELEADGTDDMYVFTKPFHLHPTPDNSVLFADHVTMYFVGEGRLQLHTKHFALVPPASGPRKGLSILYDSVNTNRIDLDRSFPDATLVRSIRGTIYAPEAALRAPEECIQTFRSVVIVDDLVEPDSCLRLTYDATVNVPMDTSRTSGLSK